MLSSASRFYQTVAPLPRFDRLTMNGNVRSSSVNNEDVKLASRRSLKKGKTSTELDHRGGSASVLHAARTMTARRMETLKYV